MKPNFVNKNLLRLSEQEAARSDSSFHNTNARLSVRVPALDVKLVDARLYNPDANRIEIEEK